MNIRNSEDIHWRKARTAARLLIRASRAPLTPRQAALALQLSDDPQVLNRLIKQALILFYGRHPHSISLD